jgi:protein SCO1
MNTSIRLLMAILVAGGLNVIHGKDVRAQGTIGSMTSQVGFDQKLGAQLPLGLRFRDQEGQEVRLGSYFSQRPVILALIYYRCPLLCNQVLNALTRGLKPLVLNAGSDFDVVVLSISPEETPELAGRKRAAYLERYGRPGTEGGWHFLTGDEPSIAALARTVGFRYTYNPATKLYAHAAGIVILTPSGRIARYFYGIDYAAKDLQYELKQAWADQIGSPIARLLLLCYDYDAATGKYTLSILRLTRVLGTATALALATFLVVMFRRGGTRQPSEDPLTQQQGAPKGNGGSGDRALLK